MKIKKGDKVRVLRGKNRGHEGMILQVLEAKNGFVAVVEGANQKTKHVKRSRGQEGKKMTFNAPLAISSLMLIEANSGKATRVGFTFDKNVKKRIAKKSKALIE
jgi:large subunit ribosomal protein L24